MTDGTAGDRPLNDPVLVAELEGLARADRTVLKDTLAALMDDQVRRIEYATSRANSLATVGGVLLAAGVAGLLQVTHDSWDYFPARIGLLALVVGFAITGAVVVWVWGRQTNWDYPFKAVSRTWKHFYRDALPNAAEPRVPWHAGISEGFRARKESQYTAGREGFVARALSLKDASISLAQDLEQSYLLHWTDLYKNQFVTRLRQVLVNGVLVSLASGLAVFVVAVFVAGDRYKNNATESSTTTSDTTSTIRWTTHGTHGASPRTSLGRKTSTTRSATSTHR